MLALDVLSSAVRLRGSRRGAPRRRRGGSDMVTSALVPGERDGAVTRPVAPAAVALAAVLPAVLYVHVFLAFPTNGRLIVEIADDGCGGPSSTGARGCADSPIAWRRPTGGCASTARRAAARACGRRSRARSAGRGQRPAARGDCAAARRGGLRGRRPVRDRRGAAGRGRRPAAQTSPSWTSACPRPTPTRASAPRARSAPPILGRRARALTVRRGRAGVPAAVRLGRGRGRTCSRSASATSPIFASAVRRVGSGGSALDPRSSPSCSAARSATTA